MESRFPPIYLCKIDVEYKKGKKTMSTHKITCDVVTTETDKSKILSDQRRKKQIERLVYPPTYKGNKILLVRKIYDCKIVGYVSSSAL